MALLPAPAEVGKLAATPPARDFVADAVAHQKFIGHVAAALPLLNVAGAAPATNQGFLPLDDPKAAPEFVALCRKLRCWDRSVGV